MCSIPNSNGLIFQSLCLKLLECRTKLTKKCSLSNDISAHCLSPVLMFCQEKTTALQNAYLLYILSCSRTTICLEEQALLHMQVSLIKWSLSVCSGLYLLANKSLSVRILNLPDYHFSSSLIPWCFFINRLSAVVFPWEGLKLTVARWSRFSDSLTVFG